MISVAFFYLNMRKRLLSIIYWRICHPNNNAKNFTEKYHKKVRFRIVDQTIRGTRNFLSRNDPNRHSSSELPGAPAAYLTFAFGGNSCVYRRARFAVAVLSG
jgi:hypothetical protein